MFEYLSKDEIQSNYERAKKVYGELGIDTDKAMAQLEGIPISLHCWQGDDVTGLEPGKDQISGGGILATGNYLGKARSGDELRRDAETAFSLIPGTHRLNLHASYLETGGKKVDRDQIEPEHFAKWIEWAKKQGIGLDFNPTFFSHPLADDGWTLAAKDAKTRQFWIRHGQKTREIAAEMGKQLGTPCINNVWIPDGSKDLPADRLGYRKILQDALDEVFEKEYDTNHLLDAVESKLFGIGSEAFVVGSHEFYLAYALTRNKVLCLDAGHFHPTEGIADKIPALLAFDMELLLHVSRGVRWDSDHVVLFNDDTRAIAHEMKRADGFDKTHFALDFFDASINRISAWVIGTRAALKALMFAILEPTELLRQTEEAGNLGNRLALMEECKSLPFGAVWDQYCVKQGVPAGPVWLDKVKQYEEDVLVHRG